MQKYEYNDKRGMGKVPATYFFPKGTGKNGSVEPLLGQDRSDL